MSGSSIDRLFNPRGVAVVGSPSPGKLGYELLHQIVKGGFQQLYAVNPRAQGVLSVPGYYAVAKIERPVDLVVIASPPPTVPAVLEDCGRAGVKAAVIITAGFSEAGNHAGEAEIKRVAERCGVRFVGPNCAGIVNTRQRLFPTLETLPPPGGVALVAQSGAVGGVFLAWAKKHHLGISKFVSYGNGADLNEIELLQYLADDPETKVVALYLESVGEIGDQRRAGREFMQVVQACTRHKPLVVIKAGRSKSGRRAALSHTGSMAGADAVYDAALRQSGAIRVETIEEMFDLCKGFLYISPPAGHRVAIVTNSGGPAVLAADRAEMDGLIVAEPSPAIKARLSRFLPAHCALTNPVDLTVEGTEAGYRETLLALLEEYDAALALNIATPYLDSLPLARGVCDAARQSGKPVVASFLPEEIVADALPYLQGRGIPNYSTGERAVATLARMAAYWTGGKNQHAFSPTETQVTQRRLPIVEPGLMLEPQAMAWLKGNGFPVPDLRYVTAREAVLDGCREIGYPVVIKVVSPEIPHKSDYGGVILGISDDADALAAFDGIRQAAGGRDFRGVVVYPMLKGAREVLLGLSHDPQFGAVVAFGMGGIYTEVWRDIALRVAPIDQLEALGMVREINAFPVLQGIRGQAPCDLEALTEVLVDLSWLPFRYPEIDEVDLNPVFLFPEGLLIGDVRVILKDGTREQAVQ